MLYSAEVCALTSSPTCVLRVLFNVRGSHATDPVGVSHVGSKFDSGLPVPIVISRAVEPPSDFDKRPWNQGVPDETGGERREVVDLRRGATQSDDPVRGFVPNPRDLGSRSRMRLPPADQRCA